MFVQIDKASILRDTIKYLKELEARVEELESCMDSVDYEERARRKYLDMVEQISDNCDKKKIDNGKKSWINKRKACEFDETDPELNRVVPEDGLPLDVKVSIKEQEVLIEMRCPYREYVLLDVMDAINNLHLEAHSVQSSAPNGILTLTLKSKVCPSCSSRFIQWLASLGPFFAFLTFSLTSISCTISVCWREFPAIITSDGVL